MQIVLGTRIKLVTLSLRLCCELRGRIALIYLPSPSEAGNHLEPLLLVENPIRFDKVEEQ